MSAPRPDTAAVVLACARGAFFPASCSVDPRWVPPSHISSLLPARDSGLFGVVCVFCSRHVEASLDALHLGVPIYSSAVFFVSRWSLRSIFAFTRAEVSIRGEAPRSVLIMSSLFLVMEVFQFLPKEAFSHLALCSHLHSSASFFSRK